MTTTPPDSTPRILLFTPWQVYVSTMLGGPIAGGTLIKKNFAALGRASTGRWALGIAAVATVAILAASLLLPYGGPRDRSLSMIVMLAYSGVAGFFAYRFQMSKAAIEASPLHGVQPLRRILLPIVGAFLVTIGLVAAAVGAEYLLAPGARGGRSIPLRDMVTVADRMEADGKSPGLVVFRLEPYGAKGPDDHVMLAYERTELGVALAWCDEVARNKADTVPFRAVAARAGVELVEVKDGDSTCLLALGPGAKALGPLVARQLYGMTDQSKVLKFELKEQK